MTGFPSRFICLPASATIIRQFPHTGNKSAHFSSQKMQVRDHFLDYFNEKGEHWSPVAVCGKRKSARARYGVRPTAWSGGLDDPRKLPPPQSSCGPPLPVSLREVLFVFPPCSLRSIQSVSRRSISRIFSSRPRSGPDRPSETAPAAFGYTAHSVRWGYYCSASFSSLP